MNVFTAIFSKIRTRDDASMVVAVTAMLISMFVGMLVLRHAYGVEERLMIGAIWFGLPLLALWRHNSRAAAVWLLLGSINGVNVMLRHGVPAVHAGSISPIALLPNLAYLWCCIRAVEATFKLHGRFKAQPKGGAA